MSKPLLVGALAMALVASFGLAACETKQEGGTAIGAITGAVIGNQFGKGSGKVAATFAGAVIGGIVGNQIGKDLDEEDRRMAAAAEYQALEYGKPGAPTPWDNPQSQHRGQIVPGKPYQQGSQYCRPYTHTIYIGGQPQTARGTACRQPDGTWQTVG
jgi:surface antigen